MSTTSFRPGDSAYVLLRKILTILNGQAMPGDSGYDLARRLLTLLDAASQAGSTGHAVHTGIIDPPATLGEDGDLFFNLQTPSLWRKGGGAWELVIDFSTYATTADLANYATLADLNDYVENPVHSTLTYSATPAIDFAGDQFKTISLTGDATFSSSNLGAVRSVTVRIVCDGSERTLGFPADWTFVGAKPATIAANKVGILTVFAYGNADTDVVAAYSVEE